MEHNKKKPEPTDPAYIEAQKQFDSQTKLIFKTAYSKLVSVGWEHHQAIRLARVRAIELRAKKVSKLNLKYGSSF